MRKYQLGETAQSTRAFTREDVSQFAALTNDFNPIHFDEEYARTTRFEKPIVHGLLVASLFGELLGVHLPGKGTIYLSQQLRFRAPVFILEEITAFVELIDIREERGTGTFRTLCSGQDGSLKIEGEAIVKLPECS